MCPKFGRHRRGFKKLSQTTLLQDEIYCAPELATWSLACKMVRRSDEGPVEYRLLSGSSFFPSFRPTLASILA